MHRMQGLTCVSNGRNSPHYHRGNQAQIMSGFDLSEHCSVCSLILDNLGYFVVLLPLP